jgi:hypothetical protein
MLTGHASASLRAGSALKR